MDHAVAGTHDPFHHRIVRCGMLPGWIPLFEARQFVLLSLKQPGDVAEILDQSVQVKSERLRLHVRISCGMPVDMAVHQPTVRAWHRARNGCHSHRLAPIIHADRSLTWDGRWAV